MSSQIARETSSECVPACPECGGRVDQSEQDAHCVECGLVVDDQQLDRGPEWRSFDSEQRKRTGAPRTVTRHDNGLSTTIGHDDSDAQGNTISGQKRRRLQRQRRYHKRAKFESKRQRNLAHGLGEIRRLTSALSVSSAVQKQASSVFRTAQDADLLHGRSIEGGAGAAVYIACRCNTVVQMARIAEVARCSETRLWTTYKAFQRELSLPIPLQEPTDWVPRILSNVPRAVSPALRQRAHDHARSATDAPGFAGKPACIAAACVYLASQETGEDWTQATVADAAEICEVSLRHWLQKLEDGVGR
jgi:transcription initiation factor TFIIB